MSVPDDLLELQQLDTQLDRLHHRRSTSPEHDTAREAHAAVGAWEQRRKAVDDALEELARSIRSEEAASADLDAQRNKLEAQLKTVIAPREAEALMHEIEGLRSKRSELDDRELQHLERQEQLEDELTELAGQEAQIRDAARVADETLAASLDSIDREIGELHEQSEPHRTNIPTELLSRYDQLRKSHGVAVARLDNRQCEGCHLQLSAAEIDVIKESPPEEPAECPQCGRLLVRA